jgi:hypothetical protein
LRLHGYGGFQGQVWYLPLIWIHLNSSGEANTVTAVGVAFMYYLQPPQIACSICIVRNGYPKYGLYMHLENSANSYLLIPLILYCMLHCINHPYTSWSFGLWSQTTQINRRMNCVGTINPLLSTEMTISRLLYAHSVEIKAMEASSSL